MRITGSICRDFGLAALFALTVACDQGKDDDDRQDETHCSETSTCPIDVEPPSVCPCACSYSGDVSTDILSGDAFPEGSSQVAGTIYFKPAPMSLSTARFYVLVDEIDQDGDVRRIIERPLSVAEKTPPVDDLLPGDDVIYGCSCAGVNYNYSYLTSPPDDGLSVRFIRGDIDVESPLDFAISFVPPDQRSQYRLGFFVDLDGDGQASSGDYISHENQPFLTQGGSSFVAITVERIDDLTKPLATAKVLPVDGWEDLVAAGMTLRLTVDLIDLAAPSDAPLLSRTVVLTDAGSWDVALYGKPDKTLGQFALAAWVDFDGDGEAGDGDYVTGDPVPVLTFGHPSTAVLELVEFP